MNKNTKIIKCKICKESYSTLITHINRKHKFSKKEYLKRFPNAELYTKEFIKKISTSAKKRFEIDPLMRIKVASRTFDFIKNKKLTPLLQRDYKSAKTCLIESLWKPSIILYASILEAILIEKYPESEDFKIAIEKAYQGKIILEREYHQLNLIRDMRNYVHIHKELSEHIEINENWAKTLADICESIIKRFNLSKN